jgi:membrane glycosyltransferase
MNQPTIRFSKAARRRYTHTAAPAVQRGSMVPTPWQGLGASLRQALQKRLKSTTAGADDAPAPRLRGAERAAVLRRRALLALVLLTAVLASVLLLMTQPMQASAPGLLPMRLLQVGLFALLLAWVAAGTVTAVMGYRSLTRGDRHALSFAHVAGHTLPASARTAVVMPICNEHVNTVFAGLAATAESIVAAGGARLVEVYVLSDSSDLELRRAEREAWLALRDRLADTGLRVHYRWRLRRTHKKAGNVADFCRRWGRLHRYMVVLDADSVMSGEAVLGLARLMEAHPRAGIIQSAPVTAGLDTLHARAQQFAGRVTGRLFSAGMRYWQLGESHYWGHNAIVRIAPFMAHCGLAPIHGRAGQLKGGLQGDILSHDFVEAALMRRAGYSVHLVSDLPGSYEQQPPHVLAELQRDRRWCQGNLQNAQLVTEPGLHPVHRAMFVTGAMAYLSAPLWLAFVLLGTALWWFGRHDLTSLVPLAPVQALWAATIGLLMLPRVLGVMLVRHEGRTAQYGGTARLVAGTVLEALLSALQAPVRMAAHTVFVVGALTGLPLQWKSPPREAVALSWRDAAPALLPLASVALAAFALAVMLGDGLVLWVAPLALPLLLAWPIAVASASPALGRWLRRHALLLTPEEAAPPPVLRRAWALADAAALPVSAPMPLASTVVARQG